jgi:hypothetical protein
VKRRAIALSAVATLGLSGCVSKDPVVLTARPAPEVYAAPRPASASPATAQAWLCRVSVAEVKDARPDPSMGGMGLRTVHAADPVAWARGGLGALSANKAIALTPAGEPADVALKVEIVKAYIEQVNMAKNATVVLKVSFSPGGGEPRIYRGLHSAINWNSTDEEIQGAMDRALNEAVMALSADLTDACRGADKARG